MTTYDNTDKGAVFPPLNKAQLILQGKVNNNGNESYVALTMSETQDGRKIIDIYEKTGTLFVNDKKGNDKAPDYTGPMGGRRVAAWKKDKEGMKYMSLTLSDKRDDSVTANESQGVTDDTIPF